MTFCDFLVKQGEVVPIYHAFDYHLLIKEHHLDTFGHVNNAVYLEILEEARWDFITARGFGLDVIHQMGVGPIVLEFHLKFLKEITLRQKIRIESQLQSYDKKIGLLRQTIFNEDEMCCCQADMTFGLFDMKARKLILPTPQWLSAIGYTIE